MEARREARRRRILENSESRLKRVFDVQSKARKKIDGEDDSYERRDEDCTPSLSQSINKDEILADATGINTFESKEDSFDTIANENEPCIHENNFGTDMKLEQNTDLKAQRTIIHKNDDVKETNGFEYDAKLLKYVEKRQMKYRMLIIFCLALLLVVVSNLRAFENTRYGEVRKSSFLPYLITLEIIMFFLFPVKRESNQSSITSLILKSFGLNERKIGMFYLVLNVTRRLFQDLVWFIFTVAILNHYIAKL